MYKLSFRRKLSSPNAKILDFGNVDMDAEMLTNTWTVYVVVACQVVTNNITMQYVKLKLGHSNRGQNNHQKLGWLYRITKFWKWSKISSPDISKCICPVHKRDGFSLVWILICSITPITPMHVMSSIYTQLPYIFFQAKYDFIVSAMIMYFIIPHTYIANNMTQSTICFQ